jgi:hypothetical protein
MVTVEDLPPMTEAEYLVLIAQHEPRVEVFRRHAAGWLYNGVTGLDAEILL